MAIGFMALATFQGYLEDLIGGQIEMNFARNMLGDFMVRKVGAGTTEAMVRPDKFWIDPADQAFVDGWVKQHPTEVKAAMRSLMVPGVANAGSSSAAFLAIGHDVAQGRILRRNWAFNTWAGRPVKDDEPTGVILGLGLGRMLGCEPTSKEQVFDPRTALIVAKERPMQCKSATLSLVGSSATGRVNAVDGDVVGLSSGQVREFDNQMLWAPLKLVQDMAGTTSVDGYQVLLNDKTQAVAIRDLMRQDAAKAGRTLNIVLWQDTEMADLFKRGTDLMSTYRSLVVFVLMAIAGTAVLTTMAKTVRERTREIGTLRSLGFRKWQMLMMFVLEAAVLALLSGVVGAIGAMGLRLGVNSLGVTYRAGLLAEDIMLSIGWSARTYVSGFVFLTTVAVVAAWIAARGVVKMKVAQALVDG